MGALKIALLIVKGALSKSHAPVHAPNLKSLQILIFSLGCMGCIKSLYNTIQILWYKSSIGGYAPYVPIKSNCGLCLTIFSGCMKEGEIC